MTAHGSATVDNWPRIAATPNTPPERVGWEGRTVDEMGSAAVLFTFDDETAQADPEQTGEEHGWRQTDAVRSS